MAQAEVEIVHAKTDLVTCYKERIEQLFNVVVNFKTNPSYTKGFVDDDNLSETATFTLQLSSSSSQESLEKALIFLKAILEESPKFTIVHKNFSTKDFDMILKNSQVIERQCLSVLDFDLTGLELCMKGQQDNVEAAQRHISHLIMGQQTNDPSGHTHKQSHSSMSGNGTDYHQDLNKHNVLSSSLVSNKGDNVPLEKSCDLFSSSHRDLDNNVILDANQHLPLRSYSLTTDEDLEFPSIPGSDLIDRGAAMMSPPLVRTFAEVVSLKDSVGSSDTGKEIIGDDSVESKPKEPESDTLSSTSSDEETSNVVDKSDPRYLSRLEFAVKLGYEERDLDRVIMRRGMECNEDKLLHELIENSAGSADPDSEVVENVSPVVAAPDIASSEVFLGVMRKVSKSEESSSSNLRPIVIDGSNVAMSHGKNVFSCRGIKIAVDWFKQRGHKEITVFVPQWRKETSRPDTPITDQDILLELEKEGIVVFTPARRIKGKRVVCYDDRFVLKLAADTNGIVVSNDNYRDLLTENKEYRTVVDERLLMYTFVNDRFMPPEDPLGRHGPTLDNFLCKEPANPPALPPECPYGRKCTYGNKCKYHHPERGSQPHRTVTEVLKEQASLKMQERAVKGPEPLDKSRRSKPKLTRTRSLAPGETVGEKSSLLPLPPALQESDSESTNRQKSPTRTGAKSADYLSEHRKKLEEIMASTSDTGLSKDQTSSAIRSQEALSPVPALGSRVSSPSHLNVPFSSSQEGQLVSGHLLLAKKLSDEASESSFFSNESSSNRASPVVLAGPAMVGVSRQESASYNVDKLYDRRPSLPDHHRQRLHNTVPFLTRDTESMMSTSVSGPGSLPSRQSLGFQHDASFMGVPGFGAQCQSYPTSEKETSHNALRRMTSYNDQLPAMSVVGGLGMETGHRERVPLKPQHSCPPSHFQHPPTLFKSQPYGGMVRQNSSSDPQLHITGSSDTGYNPYNSMPPSSMTMLDPQGARCSSGGASDRRAYSDAQQQQQQHLYRSTSMQPFRNQPSYGGLDRQISEVMFGSQDGGMGLSSPYMPSWEMGGMYHSHPSTPTHHPHAPTHHQQGTMPGSGMAPWPQSPLHQMPLSPGKSAQPAQRSFPASQPIRTSDPRYSLYYHLCNIFAEPRVRAVMNKFPDETDPQVLCARIVSEL